MGNVFTPTCAASAAIRFCWGPIHCPPTSTGTPFTCFVQVRPPTRSRASSTTTEWPFFRSARAVVRPASPAPTTTTSAERLWRRPPAMRRRGGGHRGTRAGCHGAAEQSPAGRATACKVLLLWR